MFRPGVLREIDLAGAREPRRAEIMRGPGRAMVYKTGSAGDPEALFGRMERIWEQCCAGMLLPEHKVLIKINLNTADPYPASTCPEMISALVGFLRKKGIHKITVGDCSAISALPTRGVARKSGVIRAVSGDAETVCFDENPWVRVHIPGQHLKYVTVPEAVFEADRIIFLSNMKTHRHAGFSFGLKLAVGFVHPLERHALHKEHLQKKIAEIALAVQPDLTIIDGRTAFITGGPEKGRTAEPGVVMLGTNPLAVDVEAYRELYRVKNKYRCLEGFPADPFVTDQLRHGRDIGIGGLPWEDFECVEF